MCACARSCFTAFYQNHVFRSMTRIVVTLQQTCENMHALLRAFPMTAECLRFVPPGGADRRLYVPAFARKLTIKKLQGHGWVGERGLCPSYLESKMATGNTIKHVEPQRLGLPSGPQELKPTHPIQNTEGGPVVITQTLLCLHNNQTSSWYCSHPPP